MGQEPDWLKKARENGLVTHEHGVKGLGQPDPTEEEIVAECDSEKVLTKRVIEFGQGRGWKIAHFRPAWYGEGKNRRMITAVAGDGKGFLDLLCLRERVVVIELKMDGNTPTPEQLEWIEAWRRAGVPAYVIYPDLWDLVVQILT